LRHWYSYIGIGKTSLSGARTADEPHQQPDSGDHYQDKLLTPPLQRFIEGGYFGWARKMSAVAHRWLPGI
jgi:hypothetical protein